MFGSLSRATRQALRSVVDPLSSFFLYFVYSGRHSDSVTTFVGLIAQGVTLFVSDACAVLSRLKQKYLAPPAYGVDMDQL
jgi:hypothetical protein